MQWLTEVHIAIMSMNVMAMLGFQFFGVFLTVRFLWKNDFTACIFNRKICIGCRIGGRSSPVLSGVPTATVILVHR